MWKDLIKDGVVNSIFIHVRNLVYCGLILSAGSFVHSNPPDWLFSTGIDEYSGWVIIGLGVILMLLNMADGLYHLSKLKYNFILYFILVALYLLISIRFVLIMWDFRMK